MALVRSDAEPGERGHDAGQRLVEVAGHPALKGLRFSPLPKTHGELISRLHYRLHFRTIAPADLAAVCTYLGLKASAPVTARSAAVTWQPPQLVSALLNSPALMIY